jgi:hypothetical protein
MKKGTLDSRLLSKRKRSWLTLDFALAFQWIWKSGFGRFLPPKQDSGYWMFEELIPRQSTWAKSISTGLCSQEQYCVVFYSWFLLSVQYIFR